MSDTAEGPANNKESLPGTVQNGYAERQNSVDNAQDQAQWNDLIERKKRSLTAAVRKVQEDSASAGVAQVGSDKPSTP